MRNRKKFLVTIFIGAIIISVVTSFFLWKMISMHEVPYVPRSPLINPVKSSVKIIDGIPRLVINDSVPTAFIGFQLYPVFSPYAWSESTWKERINYLSQSGFTYVCPWLYWPIMDNHETGLPNDAVEWINWAPLDKFFDYAAEKGVYVIPHFWFDYPPQWWYKEYGDNYVQLNNEGQTSGIEESKLVCFNASEAHWRYVDQAITGLVNRYKDHPALLGWALAVGSTAENNYPGGNFYGMPGWFDYSNFSKMQFRGWLRHVYGNDISALREAWNNDTVTFENAEIPQPLPPLADPTIASVNSGGDDRREFYDWQLFRLEQKRANREHFGRLYKQLDPDHIVITMAGAFPFWGGLTSYQGEIWTALAILDYYDAINAPYIDGAIGNPPINEYAWSNFRWSFLYSEIKYAQSRGKMISFFFEENGVNDKLWIIDSFIYQASALGCGIGWVDAEGGPYPWSEIEKQEIAKCWYLSQNLPANIPRKERFALIDSPVLLSMDYQEKGPSWTGYKALDLAATPELLTDAGLEYDVLTEYDIISDPSILKNYSAVALISLFRITDKLTEILVKYREDGGGLFIAGRTAVFDEYGNHNMTYLQRLLGVSQPLQEYEVDSEKSWNFVSEDESGMVRGIEGKNGDDANVYYIPTWDYEAEGYKIIGYLNSDPEGGVVGYKGKTVFWFSRLGQRRGLFQIGPISLETTLQFMRNLYDYYSIDRNEISEYWMEDIGGRYKFLLTNKEQGFNGPVGFNLKNIEENVSGRYIIYNWAEMNASAVALADENGIVTANLTLKQDTPTLLGISKCASNPKFLAAEWVVLQDELWDNQTQTLKIDLYAKINKEAQVAVYLAGREEEAVNIIGGEILKTERDDANGVLKIVFKPTNGYATLELQF